MFMWHPYLGGAILTMVLHTCCHQVLVLVTTCVITLADDSSRTRALHPTLRNISPIRIPEGKFSLICRCFVYEFCLFQTVKVEMCRVGWQATRTFLESLFQVKMTVLNQEHQQQQQYLHLHQHRSHCWGHSLTGSSHISLETIPMTSLLEQNLRISSVIVILMNTIRKIW